MASLVGMGDPVKKLADKHTRVLAHIEKMRSNKIDVCDQRLQWLEWSQVHGGTAFDLPTLLILNCSGQETVIGQMVKHAFRVQELNDVAETLESMSWVVDRVVSSTRPSVSSSTSTSSTSTTSSSTSSNSSGQSTSGQSNVDYEPLHSADDGEAPPANTEAVSQEARPDAVLVVCGSELTQFQQLVVGTLFLKGTPVLVFAEGASEETRFSARQWTAGTWPVYCRQESLMLYLEHDLPDMLRLRKLIHEDIHRRLERHKKVDLTWYAFSWGALALVPFGVSVLNAASLFDLCRQCMVDTGMREDEQAQKAMATNAGKAGAMEFACNSASDVYQLMVQGAILAEMASAGSVAAAMATLDLMDAFLLGSISVVTGAVAAVTAYVSRPQLVDSIADVVVMLQFTYCVNYAIRREKPQ